MYTLQDIFDLSVELQPVAQTAECQLAALADQACWLPGSVLMKSGAGREWSHAGLTVQTRYDKDYEDDETYEISYKDHKALITSEGVTIMQPVVSAEGSVGHKRVLDVQHRAELIRGFACQLGIAMTANSREDEPARSLFSRFVGTVTGLVGRRAAGVAEAA